MNSYDSPAEQAGSKHGTLNIVRLHSALLKHELHVASLKYVIKVKVQIVFTTYFTISSQLLRAYHTTCCTACPVGKKS
jgi:hypothetical protein